MFMCFLTVSFFFSKQKAAYELRISDWSSDVCSSDLGRFGVVGLRSRHRIHVSTAVHPAVTTETIKATHSVRLRSKRSPPLMFGEPAKGRYLCPRFVQTMQWRSEEHTSELQSLMRISYAVFCLNKKNDNITS